MPVRIERIGFFHFVEKYDQPLCALRAELEKQTEIEGSLIVLPEAFNLRVYYNQSNQQSPTIPANQALDQLTDFAKLFGGVFVVSLLEPAPDGSRYNSAFLVAPDQPHELMSQKMTPGPCYQAVEKVTGRNPLEYDGVCIAALVCDDYPRFCREDRGAPPIWTQDSTLGRKVNCIPACTDANHFPGPTVLWPDKYTVYTVLANSNPEGCKSFIANTRGEKRACFGGRGQQENKIIVRNWDELDATGTSH